MRTTAAQCSARDAPVGYRGTDAFEAARGSVARYLNAASCDGDFYLRHHLWGESGGHCLGQSLQSGDGSSSRRLNTTVTSFLAAAVPTLWRADEADPGAGQRQPGPERPGPGDYRALPGSGGKPDLQCDRLYHRFADHHPPGAPPRALVFVDGAPGRTPTARWMCRPWTRIFMPFRVTNAMDQPVSALCGYAPRSGEPAALPDRRRDDKRVDIQGTRYASGYRRFEAVPASVAQAIGLGPHWIG